MGRENKDEEVAALHRSRMLRAAQQLFEQKGYDHTTIDEICRASGYSRRTLYAYFPGKETLLYVLMEQSLGTLKEQLAQAAGLEGGFGPRFSAACRAICGFWKDSPVTCAAVQSVQGTALRSADDPVLRRVLTLGGEINGILADILQFGRQQGLVRGDLPAEWSVYLLWQSLTAMLSLADAKGKYLCAHFSMTKEQLLDCGFRQITGGLLTGHTGEGLSL